MVGVSTSATLSLSLSLRVLSLHCYLNITYMAPHPVGNLYFTGGCAESGACGHGNTTCLDSKCDNKRGGDCRGGIELYSCCVPASHCACNQEWVVKPDSSGKGCPLSLSLSLSLSCSLCPPVHTLASSINLTSQFIAGVLCVPGKGIVMVTNGGAAAGKPNCHRTQNCLTVCG
jgi:hypothetical protein